MPPSRCCNGICHSVTAMDYFIETLIFWVVRSVKRWRRTNLEREALDWPRTLGTVVAVQTKQSDKGDSSWNGRNRRSVELTYSYVATGGYYSGAHLLPPESEDEAAEVALRWKDQNLVVRYLPRDISNSVVLMHDQTAAAISALKHDPSATLQIRS
jgi:hypothetical protein